MLFAQAIGLAALIVVLKFLMPPFFDELQETLLTYLQTVQMTLGFTQATLYLR